MIKVRKLTEQTGKEPGVCLACGKSMAEEDMQEVAIYSKKQGPATAFTLCGKCMTELADAVAAMSTKERPERVVDIHVDEYYCPACGAEIPKDNSRPGENPQVDTYCPDCGQRLFLPDDFVW